MPFANVRQVKQLASLIYAAEQQKIRTSEDKKIGNRIMAAKHFSQLLIFPAVVA
ncbi:MAG: hypothetical protein AB7S77_07915 [Desulfatirhabdiaceae bacterium]